LVPDYRLGPEHPFPSAVRDAEASYRGLVDRGITKIALSGDSAGGNLALVLLSVARGQATSGSVVPAGAVALSLVTDLALTGESVATRAEADPYFNRPQAAGLVRSYLGDTDPMNPLASPFYANLKRLPAIRVHVGNDEVLFADPRALCGARRRGRRRCDARRLDGNVTRVHQRRRKSERGHAGNHRHRNMSGGTAGGGPPFALFDHAVLEG
jgi:acetyl esterase/lipase